MGRSIERVARGLRETVSIDGVGRSSQTPKNADVVVDFSSDEGARRAVEIARQLRAALLIGTTGLSAETDAAIRAAAQTLPAMKISNSSLGVAILTRLTALATSLAGSDAVIEIRETHHVHKRDAPSGTALALAAAVRGAGGAMEDRAIHSERAGEVVGDHRVTIRMPHETLALEHRALDRDLFAIGALRIADWLRRQPPGLHAIDAFVDHLLLRGNPS
jgi:4-hydroxy-tetrahydrodipicolinate reductase